jgi:hypothetical protein
VSRGRPYRSGNNGPPSWFVFLVGTAIVFGAYYIWNGAQNFFRTGGRGVVETTERAVIVASATAQSLPVTRQPSRTPFPTPFPTCQDFVVTVPNARVREQPNETSAIVESFFENDAVCVVGKPAADSEWFTIDLLPQTRRLDVAYMHESVIKALNPTLTPSMTMTPLPTVTPLPTLTPSLTPVPSLTPTIDPRATPVPLPTAIPSPTPEATSTPPRQSA